MSDYLTVPLDDVQTLLNFAQGQIRHNGNCYDGDLEDALHLEEGVELCVVCRARETLSKASDELNREPPITAEFANKLQLPHPFIPYRTQSIAVAASGISVVIEIDEGLTRAKIQLKPDEVSQFVSAILSVQDKIRL